MTVVFNKCFTAILVDRQVFSRRLPAAAVFKVTENSPFRTGFRMNGLTDLPVERLQKLHGIHPIGIIGESGFLCLSEWR